MSRYSRLYSAFYTGQCGGKRVRVLTVLFGGKTDCPEFATLGEVVQLDEVTI